MVLLQPTRISRYLASNINGVDACYNWRVVLVLQEQNNKFYSVLQYIKVLHPRGL